MLNDYSSLIEVITATYFTMCIDDVLRSIWTPEYPKKVTMLLDQIGIPIAKDMRKDIERHVETFTSDIKKHMKVKSIFMLVFCLFLLFLVGLESHLEWLKNVGNEMELVFRISLLFLLFICLGKYTFKKYSTLFFDFLIIGGILLCCYVHDFSITSTELITENRVLCFMVFVLLIPIAWQIFLCWVYSSLYYGYLRGKTKEEQLLYNRAKQAYRIKQVAAAPVEYHDSVSSDIENVILSSKEDSSVISINERFVERMEAICTLPWSVKLVWSDIKYHIKCWRYPNAQIQEGEVNSSHIFKSVTLPKLDEHSSVAQIDPTVSEEPTISKKLIIGTVAGVALAGIVIGAGRLFITKNK